MSDALDVVESGGSLAPIAALLIYQFGSLFAGGGFTANGQQMKVR